MKKNLLLLAFAGLAAVISAQTVLTYETHALKAGEDNPMSYCEYLAPGSAGENVVWDFSTLKFQKSFTGTLRQAATTQYGPNFEKANTELGEFDARFYFSVSPEKIEQYGYSSADGRGQIKYTTPFVKMKFPFEYRDAFSGSFAGGYYYTGTQTGDISGTYYVEADAWGKLILPGNSTYENTIRVKTEKSYTTQYGATEQQVEIVTYRWYNNAHRYPLLVLTEYTTTSGNSSTTSYQAAYNNNAVSAVSKLTESGFKLYPNPVNNSLIVELPLAETGTLSFRIVDASGRVVNTFEKQVDQNGFNQMDLSAEIANLMEGNYNLIISNGNSSIEENFTILK